MSDLQRYQPKTEHKGRPEGLQPIINSLPLTIDSIITERCKNFVSPIVGFGLMLLHTKRRMAVLQKILLVYSTCLDWCQIKADGLISVPHGSKRGTRETLYLPITKIKRCDIEDGDRDYMHGLARLSGVGVRWVYCILGFLCMIGLMEHAGYEITLNKDGRTIRISKYRIPFDVRDALFKISQVPAVWRERYAKKHTKAQREPAPPQPPVFRAGMPEHISEHIAARTQQFIEAIKSTAERTPAERYDELQAFGRCFVPQGP